MRPFRVVAIWMCCGGLTSSIASAQDCVLTRAVPGSPGPTATKVQLAVGRFSTMRSGGTDVIPVTSDTSGGYCRIHVSPGSDIGPFKMSFRISLSRNDGSAAPSRAVVALTSANPNAADLRMLPKSVANGVEDVIEVGIVPKRKGAHAEEFPLTLSITPDGEPAASFIFGLLWTPAPVLTFGTAATGCGADLCFLVGLDRNVELRDADTTEINTRESVAVTYRKGVNLDTIPSCCTLRRGKEGLFVQLPQALDADEYQIRVPLQAERLENRTNFPSTYWHQVRLSASVVVPNVRDIRILYPQSDSVSEELRVVRTGAGNIPVRLPRPTGRSAEDAAAFNSLKRLGTYQLRDVALATPSKPVAELFVETVTIDTIYGLLMPLFQTVKRDRLAGRPVITIQRNDSLLPLRAHFAVNAPLHIDRTLVERASRDDSAAVIRPLEKTVLRIEGAGVGFLTRAELRGGEATLMPRAGVIDSIWVEVRAGRQMRIHEPLILFEPESTSYRVPITVEPNQRVKPRLAYVTLGADGRSYNLGTPRPLTSSMTVGSLGNVRLSFNPTAVDEAEALYGVQYLKLDITLRDAYGEQQGRVDRCVAVVPPDVNSMRYAVAASCVRTDGSLPLSDLIEASYRATAGSQLVVGIVHDQAQYSNETVPARQEITLNRKGHWIVEPMFQLPTGLVAWNRGRFAPALSYMSALVNFQPKWGELRGPHRLSFQTGIALGTKSNATAQAGSLGGQLAAAFGMAYSFKPMNGNSSLDLFAGPMFPFDGRRFRRRDASIVFRPGFSLSIGGGAPHG